MKITKARLKQIIQEELDYVLKEQDPAAAVPSIKLDPMSLLSAACASPKLTTAILAAQAGKVIDNPANAVNVVTGLARTLGMQVPAEEVIQSLVDSFLAVELEMFGVKLSYKKIIDQYGDIGKTMIKAGMPVAIEIGCKLAKNIPGQQPTPTTKPAPPTETPEEGITP